MKQLFLSLTLAASSVLMISCSKDKKPDFDGTPTAISGLWTLDKTATDGILSAMAPRYGFGTDNKYEIVSGNTDEPQIQRGTYTLEPSGTGGNYTLTMIPRRGNTMTIHITQITENAIYVGAAPNLKRYFYR